MADALKDRFTAAVVHRIAGEIARVAPSFAPDRFVEVCLRGFDDLSLLERARAVQRGLVATLPADFDEAATILIASLPPPLERTEGFGIEVFGYLGHVYFAADQGLEHFEPAMRLQYELTQRFTAEFSLRAFIERHPEATLARLGAWARDPSVHVRRLVSEGTRPRLPWAPRLQRFVDDPTPMFGLLTALVDDPEPYVRRSVANHVNDVSKDHPDIALGWCRSWRRDDGSRDALIRHALRTLVKAGDPGAIALLGAAHGHAWAVGGSVDPAVVSPGDAVKVRVMVQNDGATAMRAIVDVAVRFARPAGRSATRVFKGGTFDLQPGATAVTTVSVSLREMSTRRHHPGVHPVEARVNGVATPLGAFELRRGA